MRPVAMYDLESGEGRVLYASIPDEHQDTEIKVDDKRTIIVGLRLEPEPGDQPYVAFFTLPNKEDHEDEWNKQFGHLTTFMDRFKAFVFDGADPEPELPTELVTLDGVRVVRIDLDPHVPKHVVVVPERYLT